MVIQYFVIIIICARSNLQKSINDKCKRLIATYSKEFEYRWLFKLSN